MNESLMKTDRRGRLRYTPEQKQTMVAAYRASGLSTPRFAAHHGVNYQTLVSWVKKDKQSPAPSTPGCSSSSFFSLNGVRVHGLTNVLPTLGGDPVFVTDDDRKAFLHRLGQECESHGLKVHAWVLMGNHFHLLVKSQIVIV